MATVVTLQREVDALAGRQTAHEEVCAERYKALDTNVEAVKVAQASHVMKFDQFTSDFNRMMQRVVFTLGALALGVIGYLLTLVIPGLHG